MTAESVEYGSAEDLLRRIRLIEGEMRGRDGQPKPQPQLRVVRQGLSP